MTVDAIAYTGTYDGAEHNGVVSASPSVEGAEITYSLSEDGTYTANIPQVKDAGQTTIWVKASLAEHDDAKTSVTADIAKAALSITADSKSKAYGAANPELTYQVDGLQGADTLAEIGLTPSISTTAVQTSPVGEYPITVAGDAVTTNYTVRYASKILTIVASNELTVFSHTPARALADDTSSIVTHFMPETHLKASAGTNDYTEVTEIGSGRKGFVDNKHLKD